MGNPVLYDYFDKKADALLALSKLNTIQRSSINIGDNREIFLNKFLKQSLPNKLIVQNNWEDLFDLICVLGKGVILSKGRLVSWDTKHNLYLLENKSASLAFL